MRGDGMGERKIGQQEHAPSQTSSRGFAKEKNDPVFLRVSTNPKKIDRFSRFFLCLAPEDNRR